MYEFPYGAAQQLNLNWIINEIITLHKRLDPDWELPTFDNAFPYMNLNTLNLDWILRELKEIQELAPPEGQRILKMVANALISNTYDPTAEYYVHDIVYRDEEMKLFKCITTTPASGEEWTPSHWEEIKIGELLNGGVVNNIRYYNDGSLTENKYLVQCRKNGDAFQTLLTVTDTPNTHATPLDAISASWAKLENDARVALNNRVNTFYNQLTGKNVRIYGDSISDESFTPQAFTTQPNWVGVLRTLVSPTTQIINNSIAGTSLTGAPNGIAQRIVNDADLSDADIIIIFGGVNDFRNGRTIGDYSSTADYTTVWGAMRLIFNTVSANATNAKVFVVSPLKEYAYETYPAENDAKKPLSMYRTAIQAACKWFGFMFIDGYSAPILNPYFPALTAIYQPDKIHPSSAYAPILCEYITRKVCSYETMNLGEETNIIDLSSCAESGITVSSLQGYFKQQTGEITIQGSVSYTRGNVARVDLATLPAHIRPRFYVSTTPYGTLSGTATPARLVVSAAGELFLSFMATPTGSSGTGNIIFDITFKPVFTMALSNVSM